MSSNGQNTLAIFASKNNEVAQGLREHCSKMKVSVQNTMLGMPNFSNPPHGVVLFFDHCCHDLVAFVACVDFIRNIEAKEAKKLPLVVALEKRDRQKYADCLKGSGATKVIVSPNYQKPLFSVTRNFQTIRFYDELKSVMSFL